jgi:hypothetical protein
MEIVYILYHPCDPYGSPRRYEEDYEKTFTIRKTYLNKPFSY